MALHNLFAACLLNLRAKLTALTRLYHEPGEKLNISGPTQLRYQIRDLKRIDYCQRAFLKTTERPVDALILGLIIPIVGSIFHFRMVAMVTDVGHYQNIDIWP